MLDDLEKLLGALDELEEQLPAARAQYSEVLQRLRAGQGIATALGETRPGEIRESMTDALDYFEKCRYASRLSMTHAGLDEGMSINAMSKVWGVSRQLISKLANTQRNSGLQ